MTGAASPLKKGGVPTRRSMSATKELMTLRSTPGAAMTRRRHAEQPGRGGCTERIGQAGPEQLIVRAAAAHEGLGPIEQVVGLPELGRPARPARTVRGDRCAQWQSTR